MGNSLRKNLIKDIKSVSKTHTLSKGERLGWKAISIQEKTSIRSIVGKAHKTELSDLPQRYRSCAKMI